MILFLICVLLITFLFQYFVFNSWWYLLLSIIIGFISSFLLLIILTLILLLIFTRIKQDNKFKQKYIWYLCKYVLFFMKIKVDVVNKENITDSTNVYFPNHKSYIDVIILYYAINKPVSFISKKENYSVPFLRLALKALNCISLDRENDREGAKDIIKAIKKVKEGNSFVIFPEGGIKDRSINKMVDLRAGAYKLATKAGANIIPVSIKNNHLIQYNCFKKKTNIVVKFYEPIKKDEYQDIHTITLGEKIMEMVNNDLE